MTVSRQSDTSRRPRPAQPRRALSSSLAAFEFGLPRHQSAARRRFRMSRKIDLAGQRFGALAVLQEGPMLAANRRATWQCLCDCGNRCVVVGQRLRRGEVISCGCVGRAALASRGRARRIDLSGQRFGQLTVAREDGRLGGYVAWLCRCDCGAETTVRGNNLRTGRTASCGCLKRDGEANRQRATTHGMTDSRTYRSWEAMHRRCSDPKVIGWENYGGRGISVCDQWRTFEAFFADMGERPAGTTIDRIDVNGNYEPGNCRWATSGQQAANKRTSLAARSG